MTVKQFLTRHVEGYLFKDLRTMSKIKLRKGQKIGGVGYPMVVSILAGMELLGGLLQNSPFVTMSGNYFDNYWNSFFSQHLPKYKPFGIVFRKLVRNGLAHTYLTKTGIWIVKGDPKDHLKVGKDSGNFYLVVDLYELFNDFMASYYAIVRPIVWDGIVYRGITKQIIEDRLNEIISIYEIESNTELSKIPTSSPTLPESIKAILSNPSTVPASGMAAVTYSGTVFKKN